jgi:hypothetical protein
MKADAFEDVQCPFNYKAELRKARRVLDTKVGEYIHNNPKRSYRALSEEFNLSPGTLCGITRRYERRIKATERRRDKRVGGWGSGSMRDTQIRRHPKWRFRAQPRKPK